MLVGYFVSALTAAAEKSATYDEPVHLTGGYTYWKFGDFRIQPENGNLPQRWAAIPLLFTDYQFQSRELESWRSARLQLQVVVSFLYQLGNDADRMILLGRAMIALLGVTLGALVFAWSRRLLGVAAGFTSLTLYAFCPTMLANGALATSDMAAALFFTGSVACLWMVMHRLSWQTLLVSSLVTGGLFVAKFSAPMIILIAGILVALQIASPRPLLITWRGKAHAIHSRAGRLAVYTVVAFVHLFVAWLVIWAFYNFRYEMFHPEPPVTNSTEGPPAIPNTMMESWETMLEGDTGVIHQFLVTSRELRLLPEAYLYGFAYVRKSAIERRAFLNGEFRLTGWAQFFPYCLAVKTPLTLFALMGLAIAALLRSWLKADEGVSRQFIAKMLAGLYRAAPLWVLFLVYWAFAICSYLNIGHRHLLPTYPPMLILAGGSALWLERMGPGRTSQAASPSKSKKTGDTPQTPHWLQSRRNLVLAVAMLSCLGLFVLESLAQWPNYLAYFNQTIGRQENAYRHLVDSSLDWGQDLPALREWLARDGQANPPSKIYLSYFGTASPEYYRIHAIRLPSFYSPISYTPEPLGEGTYCISATMLQSVYTSLPYPWNPENERTYQLLRTIMFEFNATAEGSPARQRLMEKLGGEAGWKQAVFGFHEASFVRLCNLLRRRSPDAEINNSILIYRVTRDDLEAALYGPPP